MNAILEQINSTGKIFVEFALPMLVQSSVLILILLLTDFALRKKVRAVFRYGIWLLVLLKLILPTSLSSPLSLGYFFGDELAYVDIAQTTAEPTETAPAIVTPMINPPRIEAGSDTSAIAPTTPTIEPAVTEPVNPTVAPLSWQGAVFLAWLTVVLTMGLLLLQRAIFVRGLVAQAKEANSMMNDTLVHCCERMGVKRKIGLKVSANAASPAVCGLFRPVILVPQNLMSSLSPSQLRAVLLHELAHIRRGDLWINLAQTFLQIIYFYNPLLWLANCIIRRVREQAVDEMVLVTMGEKARQYPQTLVNVAKLAFKRPALSLRLIGVVESKSALTGRIKHILNRPMPKRAKLGILGLAVVIITAAILLPMATCAPGPPSLVIKGTVKDAQTGEPIAGARVFDDGYGPKPNWEQIRADERSEWGAITNSAGEYSFLTWPEHHSIKVEAPGYKAERQSLYDGHFVFNTKDEEIFDFALEPEKILESSGFKKTLPNGVTVELVGICEHPSKGKQWWRPDGSKLLNRPYDKVDGNVYPNANEQAREFAVRVTSPNSKDWGYSWEIEPSGSSTSGSMPMKNGKKQKNLRYIAISMPSKYEVAKVSFAVASGPWHALDNRAGDGKGVSSSSGESGGIIWLSPHCNENETVLSVCHTYKEPQVRIVAIGKNGDLHTGSYTCGAVGEMATITATFDLLLNNIEEFQFQTRPYRLVRFEDVSLIPGNITDVKTTVSRPDKQAKFPNKTDMQSEIEGTRISTSGGKVSVVKGERGPDVTIRRKLPPEGTQYFKKFDLQYLLEIVSKSFGQDIAEAVGRKSSGLSTGPSYIQKHIGFGIPFSAKGVDGFRKMRQFQKELRETIKEDIKKTLGGIAGGGGSGDLLSIRYRAESNIGTINIFFSEKGDGILQINFVIQEVTTAKDKTDVQVEVGNTDTIDWIVEDYGQTRLLSRKEIIETDNWVSIRASAVKNNGRYLVPDSGLTLKGLIKAAGYNKDKLAESYVELIRRSRQGNITAHSIYSRNLKTLLSGEESDIVIKPHDEVVGGYIEASANAGDFWGQYSFSDVVELTVNDDGAKINMFADLDTGKLVTPPDTLDNNDENAVFRWLKENGIDVMGETADSVHGLAGFNMYAARVDNYFWDADTVGFTDRLLVGINDPVLLSVENLLPVTYLIKTSEHKMGILQILGFAEKPKGVKIRYKLLNKEAAPKTDVQVEIEPEKPAGQVQGEGSAPKQLSSGGGYQNLSREQRERLERLRANRQSLSYKNMQKLGLAVAVFANDHKGRCPSNLSDLRKYIADEQIFDWINRNVVYLGKNQQYGDPPDAVLAYDESMLKKPPQETNVLYNDAHVSFEKSEWLELKATSHQPGQKPDVQVED